MVGREGKVDRMQQAEILQRLFSVENGSPERAPTPIKSESRSCDHWSAPVLLERLAYLRKLARFGDGSASEELRIFPEHGISLSVRLRSGMVEISEGCAQLLIVLEGRATLATGQKIDETGQNNAGRIRTSVSGNGSKQELRAGDVVHIAAQTPYQMLLAGDATLGCLVIRMREGKEI